MAARPNARNLDAGTRVILGELRDLRREALADRREARDERREGRAERQQAEADMREWRQERQRSDEHFERLLHDFSEDSGRREALTQAAFRDIRSVGLSIVKTLNRHTRILEEIMRTLGQHTRILQGIDRKLSARDDGGPADGHARGA